MSSQAVKKAPSTENISGMDRFLNFIERAGNKIPDPALLFFWGLLLSGYYRQYFHVLLLI
ncbi:AbgT family transporter [Vibrio minamisatsumaniensis]